VTSEPPPFRQFILHTSSFNLPSVARRTVSSIIATCAATRRSIPNSDGVPDGKDEGRRMKDELRWELRSRRLRDFCGAANGCLDHVDLGSNALLNGELGRCLDRECPLRMFQMQPDRFRITNLRKPLEIDPSPVDAGKG
jgi:hypothetical protein